MVQSDSATIEPSIQTVYHGTVGITPSKNNHSAHRSARLPARLPRTRLLIQHASLMPPLLKEGRNEGWMNFPRGEGGMTDGSRADRSTERAGRQRDVETREGQADLSGDTKREAAELRNLPSSRPRDKFSLSSSSSMSSSSHRSPTRDRVRNAGAKWLNSELTRRSEM